MIITQAATYRNSVALFPALEVCSITHSKGDSKVVATAAPVKR